MARDFLGRHAFGDQVKNLTLARGEITVRIFHATVRLLDLLRHHPRCVRTKIAATVGQAAHRIDQLRARTVLEQEPGSTGANHMQHVFLFGMHGQHQDARMFELLAEPADDIDAVEFRHGNIQHDDIRLGFQGEFHRTHAVRRLADDPAIAAAIEQGNNPFAQDGVVIGNQDSNGLHDSSLSSCRGRRARSCRPSPGLDTRSSWPPNRRTRSRMLARPVL